MTTKTRGIVIYLLLTFGIAWLTWTLAFLFGLSATNPLFQLAALPGGFAPAIAALIVRLWITREGFADAGLRLNFRRRWPYYLFAWLHPLLVIAGIIALATLTGLAQPDYTFERGLKMLYPGAAFPAGIGLLALLQLLLTALITTPLLWGEEFGWRGYLQIRLFSQYPPLAALATGIIWGIWHYPLILMGYERYDNLPLGLLLFTLLTIVLSFIFGWLRLKTQSIWPASLAHAATNAIGGSLTFLLFLGGANLTLVAYNGVFVLIPLGLFCLWLLLSGQLQAQGEASGREGLLLSGETKS
jgi:membrane protease YdiL (CAAX protease family)